MRGSEFGKQLKIIIKRGPGGVTSIYTGTGRAIFWGAFFRAGNKFWGIIFGKIIGGHKFWGIIFSITNYGPIIRYLFPT